jgi:hypothetical protein
MVELIINPITPYICFAVAFIFFRKENVSLSRALMFPLRRAALKRTPKSKEIFTNIGILFILLGFLLAFIYVSM